jgi:hypothetical protein
VRKDIRNGQFLGSQRGQSTGDGKQRHHRHALVRSAAVRGGAMEVPGADERANEWHPRLNEITRLGAVATRAEPGVHRWLAGGVGFCMGLATGSDLLTSL